MDPQLERIIGKIVDFIHPVKIILSGSRARGDARPDSDYDLLVIYDEEMERLDVMVAIHRLFRAPKFSLDLFAMKPKDFISQSTVPSTLANLVADTGLVVYERR